MDTKYIYQESQPTYCVVINGYAITMSKDNSMLLFSKTDSTNLTAFHYANGVYEGESLADEGITKFVLGMWKQTVMHTQQTTLYDYCGRLIDKVRPNVLAFAPLKHLPKINKAVAEWMQKQNQTIVFENEAESIDYIAAMPSTYLQRHIHNFKSVSPYNFYFAINYTGQKYARLNEYGMIIVSENRDKIAFILSKGIGEE
jgi:hypothetical protein